MEYLVQPLSPRKIWVFFFTTTLLFALPLILADYFYIDDNWRAQLAGTGWKKDGRILVDWFYQGLSFTHGAPNMFPLPLLIAITAMAFALRSLAIHYFSRPSVVSCLVVLPLWYSPFFLQNLSYQYDGPAMSLGVVAIIYAICFTHPSWWGRTLSCAAFIAVGLNLYQMVINVYIGLCCVELIRAASEKQSPLQVARLVRDKGLHVLLGVAMYLATAPQLMNNNRNSLRDFSAGWAQRLLSDLHLAAQRVSLLYNEGNAWLCVALLVTAGAGLVLVICRGMRVPAGMRSRGLVAVGCLATVPVMLISIPGLALLFNYYNDGARLMMGTAPALVMLLYLAYQALGAIHHRLGCLLFLPVIAMLSFSYMHGRVLSLQRDLSVSVGQSLSYDVLSNRTLKDIQQFYLINRKTNGWLVGSDGVNALVPALRYVVNVDFFLLSEMLPRIGGVTHIASMDGATFDLMGIEKTAPMLADNKFYSLYVQGHYAYIVMKIVPAEDTY